MHKRILEISIGWNSIPQSGSKAGHRGRAEEEWRDQEEAADQQEQVAVALEVA